MLTSIIWWTEVTFTGQEHTPDRPRGLRRQSSPFSVAFAIVAVAEVGDSFLSRSPLPAAPHFEICRGRRRGRHFFVAVALTGRPSGRQNAAFCRGSPFSFFFTGRNANVTVFVVEQRESFLLLSPISVNNITHKWKWNTFTPTPPTPTRKILTSGLLTVILSISKTLFFKTTTGKSLNFL